MRVRDMEIGEVQERFANLVWDHEPIPSGQLVKLCEQELNWKKPTTYTVLRKHGSLPAFVAAFTAQKGLSAQEAEEIQQMIDKFRKEE